MKNFNVNILAPSKAEIFPYNKIVCPKTLFFGNVKNISCPLISYVFSRTMNTYTQKNIYYFFQ